MFANKIHKFLFTTRLDLFEFLTSFNGKFNYRDLTIWKVFFSRGRKVFTSVRGDEWKHSEKVLKTFLVWRDGIFGVRVLHDVKVSNVKSFLWWHEDEKSRGDVEKENSKIRSHFPCWARISLTLFWELFQDFKNFSHAESSRKYVLTFPSPFSIHMNQQRINSFLFDSVGGKFALRFHISFWARLVAPNRWGFSLNLSDAFSCVAA